MMLLAIWIEYPLDVAVKCPHHPDTGMHQEIPARIDFTFGCPF
jgi:hypothetical protein